MSRIPDSTSLGRQASNYHGVRDLKVFQLSYNLAKTIFDVSRAFPPEERYSLTDQVRRSSRSVATQISEAWRQRNYPSWFVSKITAALGEATETGVWLDMAMDFGYLNASSHDDLLAQCDEIERMLHGMLINNSRFCHDNKRGIR